MSLYDQIVQLEDSLSPFKPEDRVDWQIGRMANAMIEQVKKQASGNAVIEAVEPFKPGPNDRYVADATAGTVRAVLRQLQGAVPDDSIPIA